MEAKPAADTGVTLTIQPALVDRLLLPKPATTVDGSLRGASLAAVGEAGGVSAGPQYGLKAPATLTVDIDKLVYPLRKPDGMPPDMTDLQVALSPDSLGLTMGRRDQITRALGAIESVLDAVQDPQCL